MIVAYQGEPGAYSEEAAQALFPDGTATGYRTFAQALDALESGAAQVAVLPVENSLGGIVQEVNDLLWERGGLRIKGEHVHPIRHCLLGFPGPVAQALSHPQALAQCRKWLESHGIEAVAVHDTAGAARQVAEERKPGVAAVASAAAARRYGLEVLAEAIQDADINRTRFLVVDRGAPDRPARAGRLGYKVSLAFVTAHVPGSLVRSLYCFSSRNVNLTRLDSRPVPERPFEYRFYADFEVSDPPAAEAALQDLESHASEVRLFGTYPGFVG